MPNTTEAHRAALVRLHIDVPRAMKTRLALVTVRRKGRGARTSMSDAVRDAIEAYLRQAERAEQAATNVSS